MGHQEELDLRRLRGQKDGFAISPETQEDGTPAVTPWGRYGVQGTSGRSYTVSFRSAIPPFNHCTCPDFATNGLGTCKHVEAVRAHLNGDYREMLAEAEKSEAPFQKNLVFLDMTGPRPQVRIHISSPDAATEELVENVFGKRRVLTSKKMKEAFTDFIEEATSREIEVPPEVTSFVSRTLEEENLAETCQKLAEQLAGRQKLDQMVLLPFQAKGASFLLARRKALLADDIGLDSPRQALAAMMTLIEAGLASKIVVLCPAGRRTVWQRLLTEHTTLAVRESLRTNGPVSTTAQAHVMAYKEVYTNAAALRLHKADLIILDQVHRIRNWQGQAGQILKSLEAPHVYALGSPLLFERPVQLFFLFQLLDPYLAGPGWKFFSKHLVKDNRGAVVGHKDLPSAMERFSELILQRKRSQVSSELPETLSIMCYLEPTTTQRKLMTPSVRSLLLKLESDKEWGPVDRAEIVAQLARLRKLTNYLDVGTNPQSSPKVRELLSLMNDLSAEGLSLQALIFTRFRDVAARLSTVLTEASIPSASVSRDTDPNLTKQLTRDLESKTLKSLIICDEVLDQVDPTLANIVVHLDVPFSPATLSARARVVKRDPAEPVLLSLELILDGTVEAHARRGLAVKPDRLEALLPNVAVEMEALPAQGPEPIQEVVDIMLDPVALRASVPEPPIPVGQGKSRSKARKRLKARRKASQKGRQKTSQRGAAQRRTAVATMGDVLVLRLSTRKSKDDSSAEDYAKLGLAIAVTYSFRNDRFTAWKHEYVNHLIRAITSASLVVGLEPIAYDYQVLSAYTGLNLTRVPTLELLSEVKGSAGQWIPAELLIQATLEKRRKLLGDQAVNLWKSGRIQELAESVYEDVRLTRDLFLSALKNGKLSFRAAPSGELRPIYLDLKKHVPEGLTSVVEKRFRLLDSKR